jgi:hypothetical protein
MSCSHTGGATADDDDVERLHTSEPAEGGINPSDTMEWQELFEDSKS